MPRGVYKYILMIVPDKAHGGIRMSANIKILIVDDDVYIGDMVAAALNKGHSAGYQGFFACDGQAGAYFNAFYNLEFAGALPFEGLQ